MARAADRLEMRLGPFEATLIPRQDGSFFVSWDDPVPRVGLPTVLEAAGATAAPPRVELRGVGTFRRLSQ